MAKVLQTKKSMDLESDDNEDGEDDDDTQKKEYEKLTKNKESNRLFVHPTEVRTTLTIYF